MILFNFLTSILQLGFVVCLSIVSMNLVRYLQAFTKMSSFVGPALFVNHGGGPLPVLNDPGSKELTEHLKSVRNIVDLKRIKAIILVTAHWEENVVTISSADKHSLYFDYYNYPPESYKFRYEATGEPVLARRIKEALDSQGIKCKLDPNRGWDHGVFVPMMLINPSADIPIVQVSVLQSQDPEAHFKYGEVLGRFREEGVAVLGSGMSYHNMQRFMTYRQLPERIVNKPFDDFLYNTCTNVDPGERIKAFKDWRNQEGGTDAHPQNAAEHLMPLLVVSGAGHRDKGQRVFNWDYTHRFLLSGFLWNREE